MPAGGGLMTGALKIGDSADILGLSAIDEGKAPGIEYKSTR